MASTVRLALLLLASGPALHAADLRIALAADVTSVERGDLDRDGNPRRYLNGFTIFKRSSKTCPSCRSSE